MHKKNHIRNTLLKWLNEEWKAKKEGKEDNCAELPHEPFQRNTMPLIVPKGMPQRWHVTVALNHLHVAFTTPKSHTRRTAATVVSSCFGMHTLSL